MANPRQTMGFSPAYLTNRPTRKSNPWCRKKHIEFDENCDPENPKDITYKNILKAASTLNDFIPKTLLTMSRQYQNFEINLHYKFENFHATGSYKDRGALYCLMKLTPEQKKQGVITASTGNWALAVSFHGKTMEIPVAVILPKATVLTVKEKCEEFDTKVTLYGEDLATAKRHAFTLASARNYVYINGYDHPDVIAANGVIGLEIIEDLPTVDAILVPVGGGSLLAGIAVAAKHKNPNVLIYGVESKKNCSFTKTLQCGNLHTTPTKPSLANSLSVPQVGCNAFYTARSLIDKMVLVDDDTISRGILHLMEIENVIAEGAGAISLAALLMIPNILPELYGKTVCCVISGGNVDMVLLPSIIERAKAVEGRLLKLKVTLPAEDTRQHSKFLSIVKNVGADITELVTEPVWHDDGYLYCNSISIRCEVSSLDKACSLRRVLERLFPRQVEFVQEPFDPIPRCLCFPIRYP